MNLIVATRPLSSDNNYTNLMNLKYVNNRNSIAALFLIISFFALFSCSSRSTSNGGILVFVAASMTNSLNEVIEDFERQGGADVRVNYGGSQALAQQIVSGAPADLIISAGVFPIDFLKDKGFVESEPLNLLANKLVVVVHSEGKSVDTLSDLTSEEIERLAIADPALAPAGRYAQESLVARGMWDELQSKLIIGSDVRATMAYVESGNADAAIVYETDAKVSDNLVVLDVIPENSYSRIIYPAAIIGTSDLKPEINIFLEFLQAPQATEVFRRHGFTPLVTNP